MYLESKIRKLYLTTQWIELAKMADKISDAVMFLTGDSRDNVFRTSEEIDIKLEGEENELGKIDSI